MPETQRPAKGFFTTGKLVLLGVFGYSEEDRGSQCCLLRTI